MNELVRPPLPVDPIVFSVVGVFAFALGSCIGSFLNVVIHRVPRGESIVSPRSRCPACGMLIAWYDNIPLVSWLVLRARCRGCGARITPRYFVVELLVGLLALAAYAEFGAGLMAIYFFAFVAALVALAFIDVEHWILPDAITLPGIVLGVAFGFALFGVRRGLLMHVVGAAVGFFVFAGLSWLFSVVRGKEGLGFGDVKLLAMEGAFLGPWALLFIMLAASVQGLLAWAVALPFGGIASMAGEPAPDPAEAPGEEFKAVSTGPWRSHNLPFGPFLALAGIEFVFVGEPLMRWYFGLFGR